LDNKPLSIIQRIKNRIKRYNIIRFVIIGEGLNFHKELRVPSDEKIKDQSITHKKHKYTIKTKHLFVIKRNIIRRFKDWIRRNKKHYMIVFYDGKKEAVSLPSPSKVPSNILDLAERSNILHNALREMFASPVSKRVIIFVIIIIIVVILFMQIFQNGTLELPDWLG
jgi:hypothetical protein